MTLLSKISDIDQNSVDLSKTYAFVNLHSYRILSGNHAAYTEFDKICVDGIALVIILKFMRIRLKRQSFDFTSLADPFLCTLQVKSLTLGIVGGTSEESSTFRTKLISMYPNLSISYCRSGYFATDRDQDTAVKDIIASNPGFLLVGMGTPLQENFIYRLKSAGYKGGAATCGGFISQTARSLETTQYYPHFIDKLHLRWAYRIYDEPKLLNRYLVSYPIGLFRLVRDYMI